MLDQQVVVTLVIMEALVVMVYKAVLPVQLHTTAAVVAAAVILVVEAAVD